MNPIHHVLLFFFLTCPVLISTAAHLTDDDNRAEVTFLVSMKCESCQQRIEEKLSFEKGVKKLKVNLEQKTVTITYDTRKTSPETLKAAIQKLGYTVAPYKATQKE